MSACFAAFHARVCNLLARLEIAPDHMLAYRDAKAPCESTDTAADVHARAARDADGPREVAHGGRAPRRGIRAAPGAPCRTLRVCVPSFIVLVCFRACASALGRCGPGERMCIHASRFTLDVPACDGHFAISRPNPVHFVISSHTAPAERHAAKNAVRSSDLPCACAFVEPCLCSVAAQ